MESRIVNEIGNQQYSVQMDSTQDTAVIVQESIIFRYVLLGEVKERFFALNKVTDVTGYGLYQQMKATMEYSGLKVENIAGASVDGAANMRGEYSGVMKYIRDEAPQSVYIWCYAHILNLSSTDLVQNILPVKNLIGLLQSTVTFFSESCKRMNIWTEVASEKMVGSAKLKRLQKIGVARWWTKHAALEHIFGCFDSQQPELFHLLIAVLLRIVESPKFDAKVTFEANSLLDKWRIFDTHLTSFLL